MPIGTSVEEKQEESRVQEQAPEAGGHATFRGVPIDLMHHFEVNFNDMDLKSQDKLKEIYKMLDGDTMADKFRSLRRVELKIGKSLTRSSFERVWNYLRARTNFKKKINPEFQKEKMKALEG
jgi:hypothetical protein